jgi:hypothetical protein
MATRESTPEWPASIGGADQGHHRHPGYATVALACLMVAVAVLLLVLGRGTSFFYDDWNFVLGDYGGGIHAMLLPHNEHLSIVPIAVYKVLFHLAGLNHYGVYRAVLVVYHLTCVGLVYALARRRVGEWAALIAASLILVLGSAYDDLLWPFQIGFLGSVAGGLAAWLALDARTRRGDLLGCAALTVAIGSSGLGLPFGFGIAVELAWQREWRRLWVVGVPGILYLIWYSQFGHNDVTASSIEHAAPWVMDAVASSVGAVAGRGGLEWGRPLAVLAVLVLAWALLRRGSVSARLVGILATGTAYWILTGISRSTIVSPETPRYLYLGAVIVVLVAVELLRGRAFSRGALALAGCAAAVATVSSLTALGAFSDALRTTDSTVDAELGALQLAAGYAPAGYQPDAQNAPQVTAGPYLRVVHSIGSSPADRPAQIASASAAARAGADRVLTQLEASVAPATRRAPSAGHLRARAVAVSGMTLQSRGPCLRATTTTAPSTLVVAAPAGSLMIINASSGIAALAVKRFSESLEPLPGVPAGAASALSLRPDASPVPWQVQLQLAGTGTVSVCS